MQGDIAAGRVTLPIAYPASSRAVTAFLLIAWSWGISRKLHLDDVSAAVVGVLSLVVGTRFVSRTDSRADKVSFHWYNVSYHMRTNHSGLLSYATFPGVAWYCTCSSWILQAAPNIMTDYLRGQSKESIYAPGP